jgi:hypothetical protein
MARQGLLILRCVVALACALAVTALAAAVRAQGEENDSLHHPEQLTAGVADQFLGQLAPDGKTLYFASNRNTSNEIYAQDVDEGRAKLLFDEDAEVTWPRVSPDGTSLLYVSFGERATGQLCVRRLPGAGDRLCLAEPIAALQAEWIDKSRIVLVGRTSIEGDLRVFEVAVGSSLTVRPLFDRNLTSPTVSPDGRWLVYVPVERYVQSVGPSFAARAASRLEAVRLDRAAFGAGAEPPVTIDVDLPGQTGEPVFARDGRSLYFVQFFSDSNQDGVIDASDHGVLFRLPLTFAGDVPAVSAPEQLTETSWNCQYPAPAAQRLIATCSRGGSLDLYALPLDGEVSEKWNAEQLALEIEFAGTRAERQLLYAHRLLRATTDKGRRLIMMRLLRLHLDVEEFNAAEFYARRIATIHDPATVGLSKPLQLLVDHRKELRARERGRMVAEFGDDARQRLEDLLPKPGDSPAAATLRHVVRSEVANTTGDEALARTEMESAAVSETTPRAVLDAYYERADSLYRELDDREALASACRRLAENKALEPHDQLQYARAMVRAMTRGLPFDQADARLARERDASQGDSEIGFALDLGRAMLAIRDRHAPREALLAFYGKQTRADRKSAIVHEAVQRASEVGADPVIEALAQRYIDDAQPGTEERRRAERLYRQSLVGRAFRRMARGRLAEARADFETVAKRTGSLESVMGAIDLRLRSGERAADIGAEYDRSAAAYPHHLVNFVKAYVRTRELPALEGEAQEKVAAEALAALRASWSELRAKGAAQSLFGTLRHYEYLRTRDPAAAERANIHYLTALGLGANNPRSRATILSRLGLLHADVGNFRIALGYLKDRDQLPYEDDAEGVAVHLAEARALMHVDRAKEAADVADQALAMVDRSAALAPFRLLALDRAALFDLAAGRFARSLALYDVELPLLGPAAGVSRNPFVVRLARAAAEVGAGQAQRAIDDLVEIDRALADPRLGAALPWPHSTQDQVVRSYRRIAAGLRANASRDLGRLDDAARALGVRHALLEERLARADHPDAVRALMLVESQLAENASDRQDTATAAAWARKALQRADNLRARARGAVDRDQLDVLWLASSLARVTPPGPATDLPRRLRDAQKTIVERGDPVFREYERWFEIDMALAPAQAVPESPPLPVAP